MRLIENYARAVFYRRWLFLGAAIAVLFIGATYGAGVFDRLKSGGLDDPAAESRREAEAFERQFPDSRVSLLLLLRHPAQDIDAPEFTKAAQAILAAVRRDASVQSVTSYFDTEDARFLSRDRHATYAVISLRGSEEQRGDAYLRLKKNLAPGPFSLLFGGPVAADHEINEQVAKDIPRAEMIALPISLVLMFFIFRSLVAALLPLLIGVFAIFGAFALTRALTNAMDISIFAVNIISLLGLGLAIDYSLLFVSRFRDELATGVPVPKAIETTLRTAGESIFFSGLTVTLSLLGMLAFPESFLRSMGIGGALATAVAMLSSLTVLPTLLALLGPQVNRGRLPSRRPTAATIAPKVGFWYTFSHGVMRYAALVIPATLGLLFVTALPFLHVRFANPGPESLPPHFDSRRMADILTQDFSGDTESPIEIIATLPAAPLDSTQLDSLSDYVARLRKLPHVRTVSSLVSLDERIPTDGYSTFYSMGLPEAEMAKKRFVSGNATLLLVDYKGVSHDPATQDLVRAIRALPPPAGATLLVGGGTAELVDRLASLRAHLPVAAGAIIAATFILLCLLLSSLLVPLKAVVLNILSLGASFGLMTWIFQDGHLEKALNFKSANSLDVTLPVLIFCLAFGLATDYEVFLVSRIKEEYQRLGDNTEAVAVGVEKTGQIITSAALLLIVVIAAFGASEILPMKQIGVGLSIAIFVDAALVRTLLVPASMRYFGSWNWWLPFRSDSSER